MVGFYASCFVLISVKPLCTPDLV